MTRKKNPGSGIKKGYTYWNEMPQSSRDAISESLKGRDILWADKISSTFKTFDALSEEIKKRWRARPRGWVIYDYEDRVYILTDNLKAWCKHVGLNDSKLCSIGKFHETGNLKSSRLYLNRYDCWKVSVGKRYGIEGTKRYKSTQEPKLDPSKLFNVYDYTTGAMIASGIRLSDWSKEHGYDKSGLYSTANGKRKSSQGLFVKRVDKLDQSKRLSEQGKRTDLKRLEYV